MVKIRGAEMTIGTEGLQWLINYKSRCFYSSKKHISYTVCTQAAFGLNFKFKNIRTMWTLYLGSMASCETLRPWSLIGEISPLLPFPPHPLPLTAVGPPTSYIKSPSSFPHLSSGDNNASQGGCGDKVRKFMHNAWCKTRGHCQPRLILFI